MNTRVAFRGCFVWLIALLSVGTCHPDAQADEKLSPAARDSLVQKLYSPLERQAEFEEAANLATRAGVSAQTVAEARLVFSLRTRILDDQLVRAVSELETLRGNLRWQKDDSRLFDDPDELEGTLFFARALLAEKSGSEIEYARCLKEAFWFNPSAGNMFGQALREHRQGALPAAVLPPNETLRESTGQSIAVKDFLREHKAVLLEFWAAWCDPSIKRMDELKARAKTLVGNGVVVAGVNVDDDPSLAEQIKRAQKVTFPWLVEGAGKPLCRTLRVQTIPHAVLIGPNGQVLFSGHPDSPQLRAAVQQLGVDWKD